MAFSLKKMLSNINYFKKPEDESKDVQTDACSKKRRHSSTKSGQEAEELTANIPSEKTEADSTSIACNTFEHLEIPNANTSRNGSYSDTEIAIEVRSETPNTKQIRRRNKKLKLDIQRANKSMSEALDKAVEYVENTPKHISLGCRSSEAFSERLKEFDFTKSFDLFEAMSDGLPEEDQETQYDLESLSDHSESGSTSSNSEGKGSIQMCRKVDSIHQSMLSIEGCMMRSTTPESFADVELDKTEEDRLSLLLSYQMKLEKMERLLKKLLTEFQFHIEVSKVFHSKSVVTDTPGTNVSKLPKILGEITHLDNTSRGPSPTGSWNIIMEKEDTLTKVKLRKQLLTMKHFIEEFANVYLQNCEAMFEDRESTPDIIAKTRKFLNQRSLTFDIHKENRVTNKRLRISNKKKHKRQNDFPDLKEALQNLFSLDTDSKLVKQNSFDLTEVDDGPNCTCKCREHRASSVTSQTDSGLISKSNDQSMTSQSITSSIGNFSLDNSTLTAYSESLDQIVSYNSFQDTSLYNTLLQKAAIERITFYVQVHSIEIKSENDEADYESKSIITFYCSSCKHTESEEHGLLKHILDAKHCEKIHFLYKKAYIKSCFSLGKEIQPSTVLNPMPMYRDENKIVCFGDGKYACSLCFETQIVGESILMAHCSETDHVERRERLVDILEVE